MTEAIEFDAVVYKVQTLAEDYGIRLTIDMAEDLIPQMAMLAEARRQGLVLHFKVTAADPENREITGDDRPRPKQRKVRKGQ